MSDETTAPARTETAAPETAPAIAANVQRACDIAMGRIQPDPDATGFRVRGAHKDYNSRGSCRSHWFRMVFRGGMWAYVSRDRLPSGNLRAAERNAAVYGDVFEGEVCVTHDRGAGVDPEGGLVVADPDETGCFFLASCPVALTRDGGLKITLPDGSEFRAPNPRAK